MTVSKELGRLAGLAFLGLLITAACPAAADDLFADSSRFYLAPIIGSSWSTLSSEGDGLNRNLFTAGGAVGMAIPREAGQIRLEFESRYRDSYHLTATTTDFDASLRVGDNWSALVNAWRDFEVTDSVGLYAGGGIGGGGYSLDYLATFADPGNSLVGSTQIGTFAWQAGAGLIYALSDRVTLDLGYRFYNVADGTLPLTVFESGVPVGTLPVPLSFAASEMLLSLRIYEPFRGLTR